MRKKFTKALALVCTLCLLAPSTVALAEDTQQTSSNYQGDSTIETDNSAIPKLTRVVLPTISEDTYDFKLDVEGLLTKFDPTNYASGKTVYFNAITTEAKLELPTAPANTTYAYVVKEIAKVADTTTPSPNGTADEVLAMVTGQPVTAFDTAGLYVWQPDPDKVSTTGEGMYTAITSTNYDTFFDVTVDSDNKITALTYDTTPKAGTVATIWDGEVYQDTYTAVADSTKAATYYDAEAGTIDASLFVKVDVTSPSTSTSYAKPVLDTAGADEVQVTYKAPVTQYTNTTNKATITNKSTYDIGVIADVSVVAPGLTFKGGASALTADASVTTAEIWVGIANGNTGAPATDITYVATASDKNTAQAAFVIPGTGATANTYQTEEVDAITGGHKYYQYLAPATAAQSASFVITAGTTTGYSVPAVKTAWDAYTDTITEASKKPVISIVYKFVELVSNAASGSDWKYEAANKAAFVATGKSSALDAAGWTTYDTSNVVKVTVSVVGTNGSADKTQAEVGDVITVTPNVTTTGKMAGTASVTYFKTGDSGSATGTITDIALNDAGKYAITVPDDAIAGDFKITIAEVDKTGLDKTSYEYTAGTATTVVVYPTTGVITTVNYKNAAGATIDLVSDTDYTISDNTITFAADSGKLYTISNNRKNANNGDLTVTLCVTVNGTVYTADFTIHQAP